MCAAPGMVAAAGRLKPLRRPRMAASVNRRSTGLGTDACGWLPVDGDFRLDLTALRVQSRVTVSMACSLFQDRLRRNSGIGGDDDLAAIADFCAQENYGFTSMAPGGALACCRPRLRRVPLPA